MRVLDGLQLRLPPQEVVEVGRSTAVEYSGTNHSEEDKQAAAAEDGGAVGRARRLSVTQAKPDKIWDYLFLPALRVRLFVISLIWFASGFSYYGLTLGVSSLSGNRYINTAIMASVEIPTIMSLIPLCDSSVGRKYGVLLFFSLLGSCSGFAMVWTTDFGRLFLNVVGRAASGAAFTGVYLWSSELYPTSVRHGGMSVGSLSARIGSVGAPWAATVGVLLADALRFSEDSDLRADLPLALFGFVAVFAGFCAAIWLPETRGITSPESIADVITRFATEAKGSVLDKLPTPVVLGTGLVIALAVAFGGGALVGQIAESSIAGSAVGAIVGVLLGLRLGASYSKQRQSMSV